MPKLYASWFCCRTFRLHLRPEREAVKPTTSFNSGGKPFFYDTSELFSGELAGERGTAITGAVVNGVFRGTINTPAERYHVEPARKFFKTPQKFHSVIYRASDVTFNYTACGVSDKIRQWMRSVQSSAMPRAEADRADVPLSLHRERRQTTAFSSKVECQIRIAADHLFTRLVSLEEGMVRLSVFFIRWFAS